MPRAKRKPVTLADTAVKRGIVTPEYARHIGDGLEAVGADPAMGRHETTVRVRSSPLERLYHHRPPAITHVQYAAGLRLYELFRQSGLDPAKAMDWTRPVVDCSGGKREPMFQARALAEYGRAVKKLEPSLLAVLRHVVIAEQDIAAMPSPWGRYTQGSKVHSAEVLTLLRAGLDALSATFGMKNPHKAH